jgi:hypothetical protein
MSAILSNSEHGGSCMLRFELLSLVVGNGVQEYKVSTDEVTLAFCSLSKISISLSSDEEYSKLASTVHTQLFTLDSPRWPRVSSTASRRLTLCQVSWHGIELTKACSWTGEKGCNEFACEVDDGTLARGYGAGRSPVRPQCQAR